ncbi:MAG: hypothetical protein AB7G25_09355 [Sphingomonadaceae bacterium]
MKNSTWLKSMAGAVALMTAVSAYGAGQSGSDPYAERAIARGEWAVAEQKLTGMSGSAAADPARLINLGKVYMATGRREQALEVWRQAAETPKPYLVELQDGSVASIDQVAKTALARYGGR